MTNGILHAFEHPLGLCTFGPAEGPVLPLSNIFAFLKNFNSFERVANIACEPNDVPQTVTRSEDGIVEIHLTAK